MEKTEILEESLVLGKLFNMLGSLGWAGVSFRYSVVRAVPGTIYMIPGVAKKSLDFATYGAYRTERLK